MKIKVEHEVPYDKGKETSCQYNDGDFWGTTVCANHVYRDRTHGRRAPVERRLPKCALFGVWLDGEYKKCDACLTACKEAVGKPMQKPMTLQELRELGRDDDAFVWEERRNPDNFVKTLAGALAIMCLDARRDPYMAFAYTYNVSVRAWRTLPTDEERQAAAWES